MATVKEALLSLVFDSHTLISVRQRVPPGAARCLGGGYLPSVLRRFGGMEVSGSCIIDSVLVMYVEEDDV